MTSYRYVGPDDLLELLESVEKGQKISAPKDVLSWIEKSAQKLDGEGSVIATYVVTLGKDLLIADRHSEHVVCAGGEDVLAAGEITFRAGPDSVVVLEVTNQSTGYCPEPESWPQVRGALKRAGLDGPDSFGREFIFRRCNNCGLLNLVKDEWFVCVECDEELSPTWNVS